MRHCCRFPVVASRDPSCSFMHALHIVYMVLLPFIDDSERVVAVYATIDRRGARVIKDEKAVCNQQNHDSEMRLSFEIDLLKRNINTQSNGFFAFEIH
ncbi:hypothetical protein QVD17_10161 [Tagetes erecta]|uniref:Uncharacterized protein n=1 Tax=Tagetes erecta TaxID=13708 RepID=A0AAD8L1W1_TARER|nr:hypothetical protein QVD17_10161 [Tagetes erecta]